MSAGRVIQGTFIHGLPFASAARPEAARPDWVRQRIAAGGGFAVQPNPAPVQPLHRNGGTTAILLAPHVANFTTSGGQPLPLAVRQKMEAVFRANFADVRVHVGREATMLGAAAFTLGSSIHFAPGRYDPATPRGQQLLGHELAHVVQQRSGKIRSPFPSGLAVVHDFALEAEAERMGRCAIAAPRTVQRFSDTTINELGGAGRLSENGVFFIPDNDATTLYADTVIPRGSSSKGSPIAANGTNYQAYESDKFFRDCLHTAEEINAGRNLKPGRTRSKVVGTEKKFGRSEHKNKSVARDYGKDELEAPDVGKAYVIVDPKWPHKRKSAPYHAAAVVGEDGDDRITLEVFATDVDANARDTQGDYEMYTTREGTGETFHERWTDAYFGKKARTITIEPK